jgi:hypothetical protein
MKGRPGSLTQISSCSLSHESAGAGWDLNRPFIPAYQIQYSNQNIGAFWKTHNILYSCLKDGENGLFVQQDIRDSFNPETHLPRCATSWTIDGQFYYFIDDETQHRWVVNHAYSLLTSVRSARRPRAQLKAEIQKYTSDQTQGIIEVDDFYSGSFVSLAKSYRYSELGDLEHNARVRDFYKSNAHVY